MIFSISIVTAGVAGRTVLHRKIEEVQAYLQTISDWYGLDADKDMVNFIKKTTDVRPYKFGIPPHSYYNQSHKVFISVVLHEI